MNTKSKIIRVVYFADGSISKEVTKDLISEISKESDSRVIDEYIKTLENHGLVEISKDEQETSYELTESGQKRVKNLLTESETENKIMDAVNDFQKP